MLSLSATSHSTPSPDVRRYQVQLQQARQDAAQAADKVARLEKQTQVARQEATRADERVREIETQRPSENTTPVRRRPIASLSLLQGTLLDVVA